MPKRLVINPGKRFIQELFYKRYGVPTSDGLSRESYNPTAEDVKAGRVIRYNKDPLQRKLAASITAKDRPIQQTSPEFDFLTFGGGNLINKGFNRAVKALVGVASKGAARAIAKKAASATVRSAGNEIKNLTGRITSREAGDATASLRERVAQSSSKKPYVRPTTRRGSFNGTDDLMASPRKSRSKTSKRRTNLRDRTSSQKTKTKSTTDNNVTAPIRTKNNVQSESKKEFLTANVFPTKFANIGNPRSGGVIRLGVDNPKHIKAVNTLHLSNGDEAYIPKLARNESAPKREILVTKSGRLYDANSGRYVSTNGETLPTPSFRKSYAEEQGMIHLTPETVYGGREPGFPFDVTGQDLTGLPKLRQVPNSPLQTGNNANSIYPFDLRTIYSQRSPSLLKPRKAYVPPTTTVGPSSNPVIQRYQQMKESASSKLTSDEQKVSQLVNEEQTKQIPTTNNQSSNSPSIFSRALNTVSNVWDKGKAYLAKRKAAKDAAKAAKNSTAANPTPQTAAQETKPGFLDRRRAARADKRQRNLERDRIRSNTESNLASFWRGDPKYKDGKYVGRSKMSAKNIIKYGLGVGIPGTIAIKQINRYIDRSPSYTPKSDTNQQSQTQQIRQIADAPNAVQDTASIPRDTVVNVVPQDTTSAVRDTVINNVSQPQTTSNNNSSEVATVNNNNTNNSRQANNTNRNVSTTNNGSNVTSRDRRTAARQNRRRSRMTNNYNSARRLKAALTFKPIDDESLNYIDESDRRYNAAKNYLESKSNPSEEDIKFAREVSPELDQEIKNEDAVRKQEAIDDMMNDLDEERRRRGEVFKFGGRIYKRK